MCIVTDAVAGPRHQDAAASRCRDILARYMAVESPSFQGIFYRSKKLMRMRSRWIVARHNYGTFARRISNADTVEHPAISLKQKEDSPAIGKSFEILLAQEKCYSIGILTIAWLTVQAQNISRGVNTTIDMRISIFISLLLFNMPYGNSLVQLVKHAALKQPH